MSKRKKIGSKTWKGYPYWPYAKSKPRKAGIYWFAMGWDCKGRGRIGYDVPNARLVIEVYNINEQRHSQMVYCPLDTIKGHGRLERLFNYLLNYATPRVLEQDNG